MSRHTSPAQLTMFAADTGSHMSRLNAAMYQQLEAAFDRAKAAAPLDAYITRQTATETDRAAAILAKDTLDAAAARAAAPTAPKAPRRLWYVIDNTGTPLTGPVTKTAAQAFMVDRVRAHRSRRGTAWREARIESVNYYDWTAKPEPSADSNWPVYELRERRHGHTVTMDTLTIAPATDDGPGSPPPTVHRIHRSGTDEVIESAKRPTYDYANRHWTPRP